MPEKEDPAYNVAISIYKDLSRLCQGCTFEAEVE